MAHFIRHRRSAPLARRANRATRVSWNLVLTRVGSLAALAACLLPSLAIAEEIAADATTPRLAARPQTLTATTFKLVHDGPPAVPTGRSPYANWDDQGMRPPVDLRAAREDVTDLQRRQINAAYGHQSYRAWEHCVAGHPKYLRDLAFPSDTGRYFGYQVGGGSAFRGTGRDLDEGTFGWDYVNPLFPARVALDWSHRRVQGGTGAYATDHKKRGE